MAVSGDCVGSKNSLMATEPIAIPQSSVERSVLEQRICVLLVIHALPHKVLRGMDAWTRIYPIGRILKDPNGITMIAPNRML